MSIVLLIISIIELVIGVYSNIFIAKVSNLIFRKESGAAAFLTRIIAIALVIDPVIRIFQRFVK